mmetsp:Transcript_20209/g.56005  ORF Transcript_20209/g.56005 Transcript_20209/m.56005 type:complete len:255 (-) Transcript_20209:775-1539(-)
MIQCTWIAFSPTSSFDVPCDNILTTPGWSKLLLSTTSSSCADVAPLLRPRQSITFTATGILFSSRARYTLPKLPLPSSGPRVTLLNPEGTLYSPNAEAHTRDEVSSLCSPLRVEVIPDAVLVPMSDPSLFFTTMANQKHLASDMTSLSRSAMSITFSASTSTPSFVPGGASSLGTQDGIAVALLGARRSVEAGIKRKVSRELVELHEQLKSNVSPRPVLVPSSAWLSDSKSSQKSAPASSSRSNPEAVSKAGLA